MLLLLLQRLLQRHGRHVADEAAGVRQDVGPGVPGREGVNLQVVFHRDRSPSRGKFFF